MVQACGGLINSHGRHGFHNGRIDYREDEIGSVKRVNGTNGAHGRELSKTDHAFEHLYVKRISGLQTTSS